MTTIAFDGKTIAADSQSEDAYGLKDSVCKLLTGNDWVAAGSGEVHQIKGWFADTKDMTFDEAIAYGNPKYAKGEYDFGLILVQLGNPQAYKIVGSVFVPCGRAYHAVGSGRDFALAAMRLGYSAEEAVKVAAEFDSGTGGRIDTIQIAE